MTMDEKNLFRNFVVFMSPGTFMCETTVKPIESWNIKQACEMARGVTERYGATPFGFRFVTREIEKGRNGDPIFLKEGEPLLGKVVQESQMFYLGGRTETYEEVVKRNDPKEENLRKNMECNNIKCIIINENSYRFVAGLREGDVVLDWVK